MPNVQSPPGGNRDRTATDPSHSWVKFRRNGSMMKRKRFLKAGTKIHRVLPMLEIGYSQDWEIKSI
jgi:hypothetical protein